MELTDIRIAGLRKWWDGWKRKPCCSKETARCRSCFRFKVGPQY